MIFAFRHHTRHDLYRLWQDVRHARLEDGRAMQPGAFQIVHTPDARSRRQRVIEGIDRLLGTEDCNAIEGGALVAAVRDMFRLLRTGEFVAPDTFLGSLTMVDRPLGEVAISQRHLNRYRFVEDQTPLETEQDLLEMAVEMDDELYNGETHYVHELSRATRIDITVVRRFLARWMDDGIAYVPPSALDDEEYEPFHLEARAPLRLRNWDRYESERLRMKRFNFVIELPRPFPVNAVDLVKGIGREHDLRFEAVHEASRGFQVEGTFPAEWTETHTAQVKIRLIEAVQTAFIETRKHDIQSGVTINNFHANQVAAQGIHAVAIGNTMVQQIDSHEAEQLADQLVQLREDLQKTIASAQDAIELGSVAEAEEAAKRRDRGGLILAIKKWGTKALDKVTGLGLTVLQAWISSHTGLVIPPPAALPPQKSE